MTLFVSQSPVSIDVVQRLIRIRIFPNPPRFTKDENKAKNNDDTLVCVRRDVYEQLFEQPYALIWKDNLVPPADVERLNICSAHEDREWFIYHLSMWLGLAHLGDNTFAAVPQRSGGSTLRYWVACSFTNASQPAYGRLAKADYPQFFKNSGFTLQEMDPAKAPSWLRPEYIDATRIHDYWKQGVFVPPPDLSSLGCP